MRVAEHRRSWSDRDRGRSLRGVMCFCEDRLELGAGTVLARFPATGSGLAVGISKADGERVLALLGAAYRRSVPATILGHIQRARREWGRGEQCLAQIHLALTGLPKLEAPEEASYRLFMADALIAEGVAPADILRALDLDTAPIDALEKLYNANEPRVPAGSGRPSGEWTIDGVAGEVPVGTRSLLDPALSAEGLGALARFAARIVGSFAALGTAFIPRSTLAKPVGDTLPGRPDLRFSWSPDEGRLALWRWGDAHEERFLDAHVDAEGIFRDNRGRPLAREVEGHLVIDLYAATIDELSAFAGELGPGGSDGEEPRLCPAPKPDKKGRNGDVKNAKYKKDLDYEDQIKAWVNPDHPTPRAFGVQLPNPMNGGKLVFYDDCQREVVVMFEYKGTGYAKPLGQRSNFMRDILRKQWSEQAIRQIDASGGRPIVWVFAEKSAEEFARKTFDDSFKLKRIATLWIPAKEGAQ